MLFKDTTFYRLRTHLNSDRFAWHHSIGMYFNIQNVHTTGMHSMSASSTATHL